MSIKILICASLHAAHRALNRLEKKKTFATAAFRDFAAFPVGLDGLQITVKVLPLQDSKKKVETLSRRGQITAELCYHGWHLFFLFLIFPQSYGRKRKRSPICSRHQTLWAHPVNWSIQRGVIVLFCGGWRLETTYCRSLTALPEHLAELALLSFRSVAARAQLSHNAAFIWLTAQGEASQVGLDSELHARHKSGSLICPNMYCIFAQNHFHAKVWCERFFSLFHLVLNNISTKTMTLSLSLNKWWIIKYFIILRTI